MENKISVVVPTFNSAKTIRQCLDSLVSQNVLPQIIIADGGSTDNTMEIVKSYGDKIHVSFSEKDNGVFDAWNKGLSYVTTPWVVFLGSDDFYYDSECVSQLCAEIAAADDRVGVIYPHIYKYIEGGVVDSDDNGEVDSPINCQFYNMPFTHCGSAHRVSVFNELGVFNPAFRIAGDFEFINRMMSTYAIHYAPLYRVCIGVEGLSMSRRYRIKLISELLRIYKTYGQFGLNVPTTYLLLKYCYHKIASCLGK